MSDDEQDARGVSKKAYKHDLRALQVELVKIQRRAIRHGHRILILFEGRDAAGKDGVIKRISEHLSPRDTRVVALGKPSDRDTRSWYFQRYVPHLPADGEIALFNRSWYNRAGVEPVEARGSQLRRARRERRACAGQPSQRCSSAGPSVP